MPKVRKDQLLKFADDVTQRMADWQHKKDARCWAVLRGAGFKFDAGKVNRVISLWEGV